MSLTYDILLLLALVAFVAGYIDAIAGGGGLITVPALVLAGVDPVSAVATNKLNGTFGTASATLSFARKGHYDWREIWPLPLAGGAGSIVGALVLSHVPRGFVEAVLPFVLVAVALYFLLSPSLGDADRKRRISLAAFAGFVAPVIGFYDGVFGPGAGSFYMIGFVALMGFGAVKATAHTKLANLSSNAMSLVTYVALGQVVWAAGLAMGAGQFAGSMLGARAAMRNGAKLIRPVLVTVCIALAIRLASQPGRPLHQFFASVWPF